MHILCLGIGYLGTLKRLAVEVVVNVRPFTDSITVHNAPERDLNGIK